MGDQEKSVELTLDFSKLKKISENGLEVVPAVVQDAISSEVLILGYVNEEALKESLKTGFLTLWSTSRNELWVKGATSGNKFDIEETRVNCEQNSILFLVKPLGEGACHTKNSKGEVRKSCYYRKIEGETLKFIDE